MKKRQRRELSREIWTGIFHWKLYNSFASKLRCHAIILLDLHVWIFMEDKVELSMSLVPLHQKNHCLGMMWLCDCDFGFWWLVEFFHSWKFLHKHVIILMFGTIFEKYILKWYICATFSWKSRILGKYNIWQILDNGW